MFYHNCCAIGYVMVVLYCSIYCLQPCTLELTKVFGSFLSSGSVPSLGMGLLFGSLIGIGAYQTSNNPNNYYVALGTSVALAGFMGKRFMDSGKIMPAGLIAAIR